MEEMDKDYTITFSHNANTKGEYQASLCRITKNEGITAVASPLYTSKSYDSKEEAISDAENHYQENYAK